MKLPLPPNVQQASLPPPRLHLLYGDVLRICATAMVICLHVVVLCVPFTPAGSTTILYELAHAVCRWPVPCFLMLSGALLLTDTDESAGTFYRKRMRRVGVPILFWSVVYILLCHVWLSDATSGRQMARYIVGALLRGQPDIHLWFVFTLLGLYAVTPAIRHLWRHTGRRQRWLMTLFCLGISIAATTTSAILNDGGWRVPANPNLFTEWVFYLGYFLLGAMLRDLRLTDLAIRLCVACVVISFTSIFVGYHYAVRYDELPRAQALFHNHLSPFVFVGAVPMFLLFLNLLADRPSTSPRIVTLGTATFGTYLVHMAVLRLLLLEPHVLIWMGAQPLLAIACLTLLTVFMSFVAGLLLYQTPKVRVLVGG